MSINIAVLASGRGSNLQAILDAISTGNLDAKVQIVLVNVPGAGAIDIAAKHGVATAVVPNAGLTRKEHEEKVIAELKKHLLADPRQLARNFVQQLIVYATGTPVGFVDRAEVEAMLDRSAKNGYRVRDLMLEFVQSSLFAAP